MKRTTDLQRLSDMISAGERALRHLGSRDLAELTSDELRMDAIVRALEVLGEASKGVSTDVRGREVAIPWTQMSRMRDRLIHGYDSVDWAIVWQTVTVFVPVALPALRRLRDELLTEFPAVPPEAS